MAIPFLSWSTNPDGNRVASEAISGYGAPTNSTIGMLGQNYIDTSTSPTTTYVCTSYSQGVYTWALVVKNDSPNFTGTPTAPTASIGTNTTQIATTAFVDASLPTLTIYEVND